MKQNLLKSNITWLRICTITLIMTILCIVLLSFTVHKAADDLWKQLGISQQQGAENIRNSFMSGYLELYGVKNAKNIATGNRAAVAKDLMMYSKKFVNDPAFKKSYDNERMASKPIAPETKNFSKEEIRKEKIEEVHQWKKKSEALILKMPQLEKDMKKTMEEYNKLLADYKNPENKMIEAFYQAKIRTQKEELEKHEKRMKEWEVNYPVSYKPRIRKQLEKYLQLANTVDFDAALTEKNGKKYFTKREYESKSDDWKMIFRAGKEVYQVTRPFAEAWLKELE